MGFRSGDVVSLDDFWQHYVYEIIDQNDAAIFIGNTCDPKTTLLKLLSPVTKKRNEVYYNMPLKRAVAAIAEVRMRIVSVHSSQEDAERARNRHFDSIADKSRLYNYESRSM